MRLKMRTWWGLAVAVLVAPVGLGGCVAEDLARTEPFACSTHSQCLSGFFCDPGTGTCQRGLVPDAAVGRPPDEGIDREDADRADARPADRGPLDGAPPDRGPVDGAPPDLRAADLGPPDVAPGDAGPLDAGPLDAAPLDVGPLDADLPDAAPLDAGERPLEACALDLTFFACRLPGGLGVGQCIRGACCALDDLSPTCHPEGPGFELAGDFTPAQRFVLSDVEVTPPGGAAQSQPLLLDRAAGLAWTVLTGTYDDPAQAERACADRLRPFARPENRDYPAPSARFHLPDAYEVWSLLGAPGMPGIVSVSTLLAARENPDATQPPLLSRPVLQQGARLTVQPGIPQMAVEAGGDRVTAPLCVTGGRRPGPGTAPGRRSGDPLAQRWADPWSGLDWRFTQSFLAVPPVPDPNLLGVPPLATQAVICADTHPAPQAVVPHTVDVIGRLDIGGTADRLEVRDRLIDLAPASGTPILVADSARGVQLALRPDTLSLDDSRVVNPMENQRKLYCIAPTPAP